MLFRFTTMEGASYLVQSINEALLCRIPKKGLRIVGSVECYAQKLRSLELLGNQVSPSNECDLPHSGVRNFQHLAQSWI